MSPAALEAKIKEAQELLATEEFAEALPRFRELTTLSPDKAHVWIGLASAAAAAGEHETAEKARQRARQLAAASRNSKLLLQLGHQYQARRQSAAARSCYEQAAEADPKDINPLISLAVLTEKNHQLAESRAFVDQCFALDPRDEQARYFAAFLARRQNNLVEAERELRALIASDPKHPYVRYASRYELAQVLDHTSRFDEAMLALGEAKALVGKLADIAEVNHAYDAMVLRSRQMANQPREVVRQLAKSFPVKEREPGPTVAFLGGHPRSGTTLAEQVLGAHPQVAAVDEPHLFQRVLLTELHKLSLLSSARLNVIRRLYVKALQQEFGTGAEGRLLLEKNPSLTAALPIWLRVFPDLRVVIALRDPRDVVLSCYFQNLPLNVANANFLSLERAARHYASLMEVWQKVRQWEGFNWIETRYEDMVSNPEKEGRRLTEFLGLTWTPEQLKFYEHCQTQRLHSPTYHEVTQPIHARPVGRWRSYEKHLAPIFPILAPYCHLFGY